MWIKSTRYPVMDGEPQLGFQYEEELMGEEEEARDIVLQNIVDNDLEISHTVTTIDDYTEYDIELDTVEYLTIGEMQTIQNLVDYGSPTEWTLSKLDKYLECVA